MKPTRGPKKQDSSKNTGLTRGTKASQKKGADAKGRGRDDKSSDRKTKKDADKKEEKVISLLFHSSFFCILTLVLFISRYNILWNSDIYDVILKDILQMHILCISLII